MPVRVGPAAVLKNLLYPDSGLARRVRIRGVGRHLPTAVALSNLFLARALTRCVRHDKRCVDHEERGLMRRLLDPSHSVVDTNRPAGVDDAAIGVERDNAAAVR